MRTYMVVILTVVLLVACSSNAKTTETEENEVMHPEYKDDMQQVRQTVRSAYEEDVRELTDQEKSTLDYLTGEKYNDEEESTLRFNERLNYIDHKMLVFTYTRFVSDATGAEENLLPMLETLENGERLFSQE